MLPIIGFVATAENARVKMTTSPGLREGSPAPSPEQLTVVLDLTDPPSSMSTIKRAGSQ